jgi:hypothetical protein
MNLLKPRCQKCAALFATGVAICVVCAHQPHLHVDRVADQIDRAAQFEISDYELSGAIREPVVAQITTGSLSGVAISTSVAIGHLTDDSKA